MEVNVRVNIPHPDHCNYPLMISESNLQLKSTEIMNEGDSLVILGELKNIKLFQREM